MELSISVIGALVAIGVAILGAILANRNNISLQLRKLKEDHYIAFIDALQALASNNGQNEVKGYTEARNKLLIIGNEDVIIHLLKYEKFVDQKNLIDSISDFQIEHDLYLTDLIKTIRKDLNIKDKYYPKVFLRKPIR